jgi:hypothetical protein
MRKNLKWIVFVLLIFFIAGAFWALFGRGWISPRHLRVGSLDTLESLPPVNMPITTASEAMKFAYEREDVYTWLHRASEEFPSDTKAWDITVHSDSNANWKVRFYSDTKWPRFLHTTCMASFDTRGKEVLTSGYPNNYCEWNK